ncbi:MAG: FMN-binding glutamate synthase family protein, partial [Marmoricola sp.]
MKLTRVVGGVGLAVGAVAARDLMQKKHALMRNYPVIAHARYWLETIGPELRQYIVTGNDEERPFSRDQRSWIYASSKKENNYSGFGTDNDVEHMPGYAIIKHR